MKKILLSLALAALATACADAPTAPARAAAPEAASASTSSTFGITAELQGAPVNPGENWYFGVEMDNYSSGNIFDYYFTWTRGFTVVQEGYGLHALTIPDQQVVADIELTVEVTGPDGYASSLISLGVGPWTTAGTRTITCYTC
ncbi:MAG TPA: hypothetical protein VGC13_24985 [Longimicrobium sp.]|jgi:hypothetical protein|uniref:hypothetical protein n=1 Tax=Longimicrobium sp. TaxID=2029185 RepID=UPI002ED7E32E